MNHSDLTTRKREKNERDNNEQLNKIWMLDSPNSNSPADPTRRLSFDDYSISLPVIIEFEFHTSTSVVSNLNVLPRDIYHTISSESISQGFPLVALKFQNLPDDFSRVAPSIRLRIPVTDSSRLTGACGMPCALAPALPCVCVRVSKDPIMVCGGRVNLPCRWRPTQER